MGNGELLVLKDLYVWYTKGNPKLLMLDEPVNGLDFQSTEYLYRQIGGYRQYGTAPFFVIHPKASA